MVEVEDHFTVFVRLPFNRGDFVDPPPVAWNAAKERTLWDVLSRQSKSKELDWNDLATLFEVSQPFLLQQAAWLYERQLSQVRAQMRKVGIARQSATPSPAPGSTSASMIGGTAMKRGGSGGSRVPSRLSTHLRDSPVTRSDDSGGPGTPIKNRASLHQRSTSGTTPRSRRTSAQDHPVSQPMSRQASKEAQPAHRPQHLSPKSPVQESFESSDSETGQPTVKISTRRLNPNAARSKPRISTRTSKSSSEDDEDSPPFLPFAKSAESPTQSHHQDPSATLRGGVSSPSSPPRPSAHRRSTSERITATEPATQPLTSSVSSASSGPTPTNTLPTHTSHPNRQSRPPGPSTLSSRQTAALNLRQGSDGTPSMGSSFSDLDDTSVTQSALEEALLSKMGQNGSGNASVVSRVSGISQAFKSKYFDVQSRPVR